MVALQREQETLEIVDVFGLRPVERANGIGGELRGFIAIKYAICAPTSTGDLAESKGHRNARPERPGITFDSNRSSRVTIYN